jgi:hypothetical protein
LKLVAPSAQTSAQASGVQATADRDSGATRRIINEQMYLNYYQAERFPIAVNKYDLLHKISLDYKCEEVCILVHATNIGDKTLENINFYEFVPKDIKIINCSIPIKTNSLEEILRYFRSIEKEPYFLCAEEIISPKELSSKLMKDDPPYHLTKNFSNSSKAVLINATTEDQAKLKKTISKEFNLAILNNVLCSLALDTNHLSLQTRRLLNSTRIKQKIDRQTLNLLILRDIYPSHIKKPSGSIEIGENPQIDEEAGVIHATFSQMRPKESAILVYYANISTHNIQKVNTIIDISDDKYPYLQFPLDVTFPYPKFNVRVVLPKQEVKPREPIYINYIVDLLVPNNESSDFRFSADVENNNNNISFPDNRSKLIFRFSNGSISNNNSTTIKINQSGSYSIPILVIGDGQYLVQDKYIKVEELWSKYILQLTLIFIGVFTLIGGNLRRIESSSIYKIFLLIVVLLAISIAFALLEISAFYSASITLLSIFIIVYWYK